MRKYAAYGVAALLAVSAVAGVSYAQDTTPPTDDTEAVMPSAVAQRTWLGVAVDEEGDGVIITQVSANSPAESAQLQAGDVIQAVDDVSVDTVSDLQAIIEAAASGDVVSLTIERDSEQLSVDVTLSSRAGRGGFGQPNDPVQTAERMLGADLEAVDDGYQVVSINADASFDLAVDDVITSVNDEPITSVDWMTLMDPTGENTVTLTVLRDGAETTLEGQLAFFGGQPGGFSQGDGQQPNGGRDNRQPNDQQPGEFPPGDGQPDMNGSGTSI